MASGVEIDGLHTVVDEEIPDSPFLTIVIDLLGFPQDNSTDDNVPIEHRFCRDWLWEQYWNRIAEPAAKRLKLELSDRASGPYIYDSSNLQVVEAQIGEYLSWLVSERESLI